MIELLVPSSRGGVDAPSKTLDGAARVVRNDGPPRLRGSKVAARFFLDRAATPPLEEGTRQDP